MTNAATPKPTTSNKNKALLVGLGGLLMEAIRLAVEHFGWLTF